MTSVLIKRGDLDTETRTQGEHHVKMKVEIGVMLLQAKKYQRLPANQQRFTE